MILKKAGLKNIIENGENARKQHFPFSCFVFYPIIFSFPALFSILSNKEILI